MSRSLLHKVYSPVFAAVIVSVFVICANAQRVDEAAIKKAIENLSFSYKDVPSSLTCKQPATKAEKIICADPLLRLMERLDTMASVYMVENGTHRELSHNKKTVMRESSIKTIRKLRTAAAIRKAYIENTNEALGGESPYSVDYQQ